MSKRNPYKWVDDFAATVAEVAQGVDASPLKRAVSNIHNLVDSPYNDPRWVSAELRKMQPLLDPNTPGSAAPTGPMGPVRGAPPDQVALAQKYGAQYGVDPKLLLAIAKHETNFGTLGAGRKGYHLGYGATDSGKISKYAGVDNQYRFAAATLARRGVRTLADVQAGKAHWYATDPKWEAGIARAYGSL